MADKKFSVIETGDYGSNRNRGLRGIKNMKKRKVYYGLAFLIPVMIIAGSFLAGRIAPFGDECLLAMDAWGQYFPMLKEMKRALLSGNMGWSFDGALGFNLWAQNAYYTNSPLWIVLFFLPDEAMIAGVDVLVMLRFGLCGMTFAYWLDRHYGKRSWGGVSLACAYALSAYTLAFINQFMWMDVVILLPLVILGLEQLFYKKKPLLYTITLALSIWANFYIGYMVCLFCVIYFLILLFEKRMAFCERIKKGVSFAWYSLLAGGICAATLVPVYFALQHTKSADMMFEDSFRFYHSAAEMLKKFLPFSKISLVFEAPNVYCGLICLLLFVLTFFIRKISIRRKILTAAVVLFLLLSMNLNILDFIWHGFHYPNQLPGRESFLLVFVVLTFACPAYSALTDYCKRKAETNREECFYQFIPVILAAVMIFEAGSNAVYTITEQTWKTSASEYLMNDLDMKKVLEKYKWNNSRETGFYRMERSIPHNLNNGQLYGCPGITYYSSTMPEAAYDFFGALGIDAYADLIVKYSSSPITNALFSVRYILCFENVLPLDDNLAVVDKIGNITVLENTSVLPFAFMSDYGIMELDKDGDFGIALQKKILEKMCGVEEITFSEAVSRLKEQPYEIKEMKNDYISGIVQCTNDGILYTSLPNDGGWSVYVDGKKETMLTILDYLCGVELSAGIHQVEFLYEVPGIRMGVCLSVLSAILLIISVRKRKH